MQTLSLEHLLKNEQKDLHGNSHFAANGRLVASYFPTASFDYTIYPDDEPGGIIRLRHQGPVVAVYTREILVSGSLQSALEEQILFSAFSHCAINGLIFYSDVLAIEFENPKFPSAHTSMYDDGDELHDLAREILLHKIGGEWNYNFVNEAIANNDTDFVRTFLDHIED